MGAEQFYNRVKSASASEAFNSAREEALYDHGHSGYSGTIAEKGGFTMSQKPDAIPASVWVDMVDDFDENEEGQEYYSDLKRDYEVYDDKWGDALCIEDGDYFILCGWASS